MTQPIEAAKSEVTMAHDDFFQALLKSDVKALETLTTDSFVWINRKGEQQSREQLVNLLSSKRLQYSNLTTTKASVRVSGETAIVQGTTQGERTTDAASGTVTSPGSAAYTLVFSNQGGAWLALAMHFSEVD